MFFSPIRNHPQKAHKQNSATHPVPGTIPQICLCLYVFLREAKPGGFQTRVFPTFLGKVQIVSRTLSGLFLVGALNRPRKRKRTNRKNPRTIPEQIGKIPEKSGKSRKGQKRTKTEGQVQIGKPPRLKHPRLAALDFLSLSKTHCQSGFTKTLVLFFQAFPVPGMVLLKRLVARRAIFCFKGKGS